MKKKRLFIGIPLLEDVQKRLKKDLKQIPGRIVPAPNWHITLNFLGNISEEKIPDLDDLIKRTAKNRAFQLSFSRLGAFPNVEQATVLWLGPKEGFQSLLMLNTKLGEALKREGFSFDNRAFIPHITVSKFSNPKDVREWIAKVQLKEWSFLVSEIVLYQSVLEEPHSRYVKLFSYPLI